MPRTFISTVFRGCSLELALCSSSSSDSWCWSEIWFYIIVSDTPDFQLFISIRNDLTHDKKMAINSLYHKWSYRPMIISTLLSLPKTALHTFILHSNSQMGNKNLRQITNLGACHTQKLIYHSSVHIYYHAGISNWPLDLKNNDVQAVSFGEELRALIGEYWRCSAAKRPCHASPVAPASWKLRSFFCLL